MYTWCYFSTVYLTPSLRCIPGRCQKKYGLSVEFVMIGDDSILDIVTAGGCVRRVGKNSSHKQCDMSTWFYFSTVYLTPSPRVFQADARRNMACQWNL